MVVSNISMTGFFLVPVLLGTASFADAFLPKSCVIYASPARARYALSTSSACRLLQSRIPADDDNDEEENNEQLFFEDFGGFVAGASSADETPSSFFSSLTERIDQTRAGEIRRDARLAKNWKTGNWGVRGFILDKSDPIREAVADTTAATGASADDATDPVESSAPRNSRKSGPTDEVAPIHVSAIVPDQSSFHDDHDEIAEFDTIAVGRTDGTVLITKLGTAYMTKFTAVPKLRVDDSSAWAGDSDDDDDDASSSKGNDDLVEEGGPSVNVETELVNTEELRRDLVDIDEDASATQNMQDPMEDPFDELYGGNDGADRIPSPQEVSDPGTPFRVLYQFRAHENTIGALLFDGQTVYTAGGDSGEIRSWTIPEDDKDNEDDSNVAAKMIPGKTLSDAHSDAIVALKTVSSTRDADSPDLLLSASRDGSFALWDVKSGDLVLRCHMLDDSADSVMISCADIDTTGKGGDVIYFGTSSGHVVAYDVSDVIGSASAGGVCPIPICRFLAHEEAVTSILAVGEGTSASSAIRPTSVVLTGGADGNVKQWEMMSRPQPQESKESDMSSPSYKLEHWPRLANQRMKRRAHMFQGHAKAVNALAQVDSTKFLSASEDGTIRVWSPSEGKEMYRLDGFTDSISSLVLAKETLITDGMENMVCVHDFDVDIDDADSGYELEW